MGSQLRKKDLEYLNKRGFTEEFINERCFGYCGQTFPKDQETAKKLGLMNEKGFYFPSKRVIIPFYQYGKLVQLALHKPGKEPKYLYPIGWNKPLIGIEYINKNQAPFLVEGVFCYYSILQAGLPALTALGKPSQEQKKVLQEAREFHICFDGDETGRSTARELAREFYPKAKVIDLPEGKDINDLLQEFGPEGLRNYLLEQTAQAKSYVDIVLNELTQEPENSSKQKEALQLIACLTSPVEQEVIINELVKILKPLGIGKTAIRNEIKRIHSEQKKQEKEEYTERKGQEQYTAEFTGLVDICESSITGKPCFLVLEPNKEGGLELREIEGYYNFNGEEYLPPPREQMPWLLANAEAVLYHYKNDDDYSLYLDLVKYFKGVSELPGENYYMLLAWWVLHTYLSEKSEYSPYLWFYAVPERGKSRTGKAAIYLAWRGVHVESLRDAYLVRIANNFRASLFFDCMDLWVKAEKQGTEDIILHRFEKGAKVPRVLYPEKGAFKDTVYYRTFGPTLIATNKQVHKILETRAVQVNMPASSRRFENDVKPENGLELKERLTAFRARQLNKILPQMDKPASGRLGDIMRPLLQVVHIVSPEDEENFREFLREIEESRKLEKSSGQEAQILQAIISLEEEVSAGLLSIKLITERYNESKKEKFQLTNQGMGHRLKALGFSKRKLSDGRMAIYLDGKLLEKNCFCYSIEDSLKNLRHFRNAQKANNDGLSINGGFVGDDGDFAGDDKKPPPPEVPASGLFGNNGDDEDFSKGAEENENKKYTSGDEAEDYLEVEL